MIIISLIVAIYYNVIMAYSIIYVGASLRGVRGSLPWAACSEWWGADGNCTARGNLTADQAAELRLKRCSAVLRDNCTQLQSSAEQFWEKYILGLGPGFTQHNFGDLGGWKWDLPLALALSWAIVFLCLMKGVKSSGKVVYFTATFPYVVLIALLVRGVTLDGAHKGLLLFPWPCIKIFYSLKHFL